MRRSKHEFWKKETDLFLREGLDWQISRDAVAEIRLSAHANR
jgi:hypothetical protein